MTQCLGDGGFESFVMKNKTRGYLRGYAGVQ